MHERSTERRAAASAWLARAGLVALAFSLACGGRSTQNEQTLAPELAAPRDHDVCGELAQRAEGIAGLRRWEGEVVAVAFRELEDPAALARSIEEQVPGATVIPFAIYEANVLGPAAVATHSVQAFPPGAFAALVPYVADGSLEPLVRGERAIAIGVDIAEYMDVGVGDVLGVAPLPAEGTVVAEQPVPIRVAALLHFPAGRLLGLDAHYALTPIARAEELAGEQGRVAGFHVRFAEPGGDDRAARVQRALDGQPLQVIPFEQLHAQLLRLVPLIEGWCAEQRP